MGKVKMRQISLYFISVLLIYALKKLRITNFHLSTPKCYIRGQLQSRDCLIMWVKCKDYQKFKMNDVLYSEGKPLLSIKAMNW